VLASNNGLSEQRVFVCDYGSDDEAVDGSAAMAGSVAIVTKTILLGRQDLWKNSRVQLDFWRHLTPSRITLNGG
jgi:hypothetical protein